MTLTTVFGFFLALVFTIQTSIAATVDATSKRVPGRLTFWMFVVTLTAAFGLSFLKSPFYLGSFAGGFLWGLVIISIELNRSRVLVGGADLWMAFMLGTWVTIAQRTAALFYYDFIEQIHRTDPPSPYLLITVLPPLVAIFASGLFGIFTHIVRRKEDKVPHIPSMVAGAWVAVISIGWTLVWSLSKLSLTFEEYGRLLAQVSGV